MCQLFPMKIPANPVVTWITQGNKTLKAKQSKAKQNRNMVKMPLRNSCVEAGSAMLSKYLPTLWEPWEACLTQRRGAREVLKGRVEQRRKEGWNNRRKKSKTKRGRREKEREAEGGRKGGRNGRKKREREERRERGLMGSDREGRATGKEERS